MKILFMECVDEESRVVIKDGVRVESHTRMIAQVPCIRVHTGKSPKVLGDRRVNGSTNVVNPN